MNYLVLGSDRFFLMLLSENISGASQKTRWPRASPTCRSTTTCLTVFQKLELSGITLGIKITHERITRSALSGGEQKHLEVGGALLLWPKVLLIDEPSGLSPLVVQDVFKLLQNLAAQDTTF